MLAALTDTRSELDGRMFLSGSRFGQSPGVNLERECAFHDKYGWLRSRPQSCIEFLDPAGIADDGWTVYPADAVEPTA